MPERTPTLPAPFSKVGSPGAPIRWVGSAGGIEFAVSADGTVPNLARLICLPVIVPFLIFAAVTASFLILEVITAFFFSCLLPTLFLPSAAQAVPVNAQISATMATIIAGDGRRDGLALKMYPFLEMT